MDRYVTEAQLKERVQALNENCLELGLTQEGEEIRIQIGSNINGIAFRLWLKKPESSAHHNTPFNDLLGFTKPQAWKTVCTMNDVLWAVIRDNREALRHA